VGHSDYLLLLTTVVLQLALVAIRVTVGATHGLVVFGTQGTFAGGFSVSDFTSGPRAAQVPVARIRVPCANKHKKNWFEYDETELEILCERERERERVKYDEGASLKLIYFTLIQPNSIFMLSYRTMFLSKC